MQDEAPKTERPTVRSETPLVAWPTPKSQMAPLPGRTTPEGCRETELTAPRPKSPPTELTREQRIRISALKIAVEWGNGRLFEVADEMAKFIRSGEYTMHSPDTD